MQEFTTEDVGSSGHQKVSAKRILKILVPEYKLMGLAMGGISISATATMAFPDAIGKMIDLLSLPLTDASMAEMQWISLSMVGIFSIGAVATAGHTAILETVGQRVGANLRKRLFSRIMSQNKSFFDKHKSGELANRLSTDVHEVAEHLVENMAKLLESSVKSISAVGAMLFLSPGLTMCTAAVAPVVLAGTMLYGKVIKKLSAKHLDALAGSTHVAAERFNGITTVLGFGQKEAEEARYGRVIDRSYKLGKKAALFEGGYLGGSYLVGNATLLGVLWLGAKMVMEGSLTAGQLTAFVMYAGHLAGCVDECSEGISGFLRAQGSGARLFALLDADDTSISGDKVLPDAYEGVVRFEDVSFSYPRCPQVKILNNLNLTLKPGELVGVTGQSGCGKSSLLSLLQRLYEPTSGRITLDGVDIRELDTKWLRSQFAVVSQEPVLFAATIRENIAYGMPSANLKQVQEAATKAQLHEFIISLPAGYDSVVGERGATMSGGQKQRLAVARALLLKPRLLVLDEITSALDVQGEQAVMHAVMHVVRQEKTTAIMSSHCCTTLSMADRTEKLEDGMLVGSNAVVEDRELPREWLRAPAGGVRMDESEPVQKQAFATN